MTDDVARRTNRLPYALASHIAGCSSCRALADRLGKVTIAFEGLRGRPPGSSLLSRANVHALRMLRRSVRASRRAHQLAQARVGVGLRSRVRVVISRLALTVTTATLILALRVGLRDGWREGSMLTQKLADKHVQYHIYGLTDDDWT